MISFNGNNLESAYLIINRLNKSDAPQRELQNEVLSFQDGHSVIADFWRSRSISISGMINATSAAHLGTLLDTLKGDLSGKEKNLDVDYGGGTRRYVGTMTALNAPEEFYNITHLPYTAQFICQPFGKETSVTTFSSNDITASTETDSITTTGSYKPQPLIQITFDSATAVTGVSFENTTTGDTISITETIVAGDVLIIDTETHKVTLEGTQVDFDGPMPDFVLGLNSFSIEVDSTAHQYDLEITYTPTYL